MPRLVSAGNNALEGPELQIVVERSDAEVGGAFKSGLQGLVVACPDTRHGRKGKVGIHALFCEAIKRSDIF